MSATVLLIEDNLATAKVVRLTLGAEGYRLLEANDAAQALRQLEEETPDLILQDLMLPDCDGFELVEQLRARPALAAVPIVAFSGFLSRIEYGRATTAGFSDFLTKPVEPSRLLQVVKAHLPNVPDAPARYEPPLGKRRVVVADDDPVQLKLACIILKQRGYQVVAARDGIEALELLRAEHADALISDVLMPRLDGFELCAALRADPALAGLPAVLVSSHYVDEADRRLARDMGASAFVFRQPNLSDAIEALERALGSDEPPSVVAVSVDTGKHQARVARQLERQAAINEAAAHRLSMQASMLSVVAGISEALIVGHSVDDALGDILASLLDAAGVSRGALLLSRSPATAMPGPPAKDGEQVVLQLAASLGFDTPAVAELPRRLARADAYQRCLSTRAAIALDASADPNDRALLTDLGVGSALLVPLVTGSHTLGLIVLGSEERDLSQSDWLPFARAVGSQISQAMALSRAFATLAASEKRYRALWTAAHDGLLLVDLGGVILDVNAATEKLLGRSREALIGAHLQEMLAPEDRGDHRKRFAKLMREGHMRVEARRYPRPDGSEVYADISATLIEIDDQLAVLGVAHDVTEKVTRQAELALLQELELAMSRAPDLDAVLDAALARVCEAGGWALGIAWEPVGEVMRAIRVHGSEPRWRELASELVADPQTVSARAAAMGLEPGLVIPISGAAGLSLLIELFGAGARPPERSALEANPQLASAIATAIQRKRAEAALRVSEARFARLAESGIIGIAIADRHGGGVSEANDALLELLGYTRAELEAGEVRWASPSEWQYTDARADAELDATGVAQVWEKEIYRRDGSLVPVRVGVAALDRDQVIAVVSDLSESKRVEEALRQSDEQLRQAQKMEAIGVLAGGVAHDFNNMLSIILSFAEFGLMELAEGDPMREYLEQIVMAGKRAADLTRQLLIFSRKQVIEPHVIGIGEVLAAMHKMLGRLVGADVELTVRSAADVGAVRCDRGSLEQVLMNLVVNARDAMPTGGHLTIEADNFRVDEELARSHPGVAPGEYVMLSVSDTGVGMDKETLARIFEPFFTTKEKGKGTGLGLSTVFGIVRQNGGDVMVASEPGRGATFEILLPRIDEAGMDRAEAVPLQALRGGETILLVEDDDEVRAAALGILRRQGYQVIEARNAGEAILFVETSASEIDLLLTDVVMPRMSGPELARRLAKDRPDMKVLCMSGYTDDSIVRHGVLEAKIAYLQKPLTMASLTRKVRQVLDGGPPTGIWPRQVR